MTMEEVLTTEVNFPMHELSTPTANDASTNGDCTYHSPCGGKAYLRSAAKRRAWGLEWHAFLKRTTFHGVRYIYDDTPFKLRRLFWLLLVVLCSSLTLWQTVDQTRFYFSYPIRVNSNIYFNQTLKMPTLTLCNLNNFRLTVAQQLGYYDLLNTLFSGRPTAEDVAKDGWNNISLYELFVATAHRPSDVIVSCSWNDHPCSADNFTTVFTDMGVCFQLKMDSQPGGELKAYDTGALNGLSLGINVEQYEYMRSVDGGAGLRILLHDPTEFPLVRDLGLGIGTGTHGFLGLQMRQLINIDLPYGNCTDEVIPEMEYFTTYSITNCKVDCQTRFVVRYCGCRLLHMPETSRTLGSAPFCTVHQYVNCVYPTLDKLKRDEDACLCPNPCNRTLYDVTISYASTSNWDAQGYLRNLNKTQLKQDYVYARETQYMVVDMLRQDEMLLANSFLSSIKELDTFLLKQLVVILQQARRKLIEIGDSTDDDVRVHMAALKQQLWVLRTYFLNGVIRRNTETLSQIANGYSTLFETFEMRINELVDEDDRTYRKVIYNIITHDMRARLAVGRRCQEDVQEIYRAFARGIPLDNKTQSKFGYEADMLLVPAHLLWKNSRGFNATHSRCQESLIRFNSWIRRLLSIARTVYESRELNSTAYKEARRGYISSARTFLLHLQDLETSYLLYPEEELRKHMTDFRDTAEGATGPIREFQAMVVSLNLSLADIRNASWRVLLGAGDMTQNYMIGTLNDMNGTWVRKTAVCEAITSQQIERAVGDLKVFLAEVRTRSQGFADTLTDLMHKLQDLWQMILQNRNLIRLAEVRTRSQGFADTLTDLMHKLQDLWQMILQNRNLIRYYQAIDEERFIAVNRRTRMADIEHYFDDLLELYDLVNTIGSDEENFLTSLTDIKDDCQKFIDINEIDDHFVRENFLQLDIFYSELSYEVIEQQQAYSLYALFCDIGGLMGLFIGGSLITLFEILDVLMHSSFKLCLGYYKNPDDKEERQLSERKLLEKT